MNHETSRNDERANAAANSARDRVESRLRERERFLRTLISNLPGIVYRCRTDELWTPEFMSDGVELTGYPAEAFVDARRIRWDDVIHPQDRERARSAVRAHIAARSPLSTKSYVLSYRIVAASGELKDVRDRFRFVYDHRGEVVALEGVMTDVTELTLADESARASEDRYRLLAEHMNDLVCLHELDGTYLYLSPSCARVLGFRPEELVGTSAFALCHPNDLARVREAARRSQIADEADAPLVYRMRRASGEYVWLETMSQRVAADRCEHARLLTCSRDITKRREAEEARALGDEQRAESLARERSARHEAERQRERAERAGRAAEAARIEAVLANRAKDEFLQMVSHEFRTPLATIKTAARVLLRDGVSAGERAEYLETIGSECDRQIDMIVNLLDVSRLDAGAFDLELERVSLGDLLRSCDRVERTAALARGQAFAVEPGDDLPAVRGDAKALRRALCTIVENAIKYTPEGGRILVFGERVSDAEVAIHVLDDGRGIGPDEVPHIFEKFFRGAGPGSAPGIGLGLYLAERIVAALDGRIEVESQSNRGSKFSVILPVWNEAQDDGYSGHGGAD